MTDEDKKRLRELAAKITPIECWVEGKYPDTKKEIAICVESHHSFVAYFGTVANRDFALLAIRNVLGLLEEIDRLRVEIDDLWEQKARWEY